MPDFSPLTSQPILRTFAVSVICLTPHPKMRTPTCAPLFPLSAIRLKFIPIAYRGYSLELSTIAPNLRTSSPEFHLTTGIHSTCDIGGIPPENLRTSYLSTIAPKALSRPDASE